MPGTTYYFYTAIALFSLLAGFSTVSQGAWFKSDLTKTILLLLTLTSLISGITFCVIYKFWLHIPLMLAFTVFFSRSGFKLYYIIRDLLK